MKKREMDSIKSILSTSNLDNYDLIFRDSKDKNFSLIQIADIMAGSIRTYYESCLPLSTHNYYCFNCFSLVIRKRINNLITKCVLFLKQAWHKKEAEPFLPSVPCGFYTLPRIRNIQPLNQHIHFSSLLYIIPRGMMLYNHKNSISSPGTARKRNLAGCFFIPIFRGYHGYRKKKLPSGLWQCQIYDYTDENGNIAHIQRAIVLDENKQWVDKTTISSRFINLVACSRLPCFRFHDLRHY